MNINMPLIAGAISSAIFGTGSVRWDCNERSAWIAKSKPEPLDLAIQGEQIRQILP